MMFFKFIKIIKIIFIIQLIIDFLIIFNLYFTFNYHFKSIIHYFIIIITYYPYSLTITIIICYSIHFLYPIVYLHKYEQHQTQLVSTPSINQFIRFIQLIYSFKQLLSKVAHHFAFTAIKFIISLL